MSDILNLSRRGFLKGMVTTGALVLSVRFLPSGLLAAGEEVAYAGTHTDHATLHPGVYVGIDTDGTVYIVAHRSEMGTGIRTSLPLVLADELDADWKRVKIEQAIGDARYGSQETDGSQSIREFYDAMREAGATVRLMLTRAAAQQWNVPESECRADLHHIVHGSPIRKLSYGELTMAAAKLPVPDKKELQFKPPSAWRYIGKGMVSYDLSHLVTGQAVYGMDAHMDNMVYASVEHPPVLGGTIKSYDDKAALQVPGVRQTIPIDTFKPPHEYQALGGVAVIADNTWAAFQGRKKLNITWDNGPHAVFNSDDFKKEMQATARKPGKAVRNEGDVDAGFAKGGKVLEADYYVPLLAHASMEPPVAVADFRDGKLTAWAPTQDPQVTQDAVSKALGIAKENVICHVTLLGGAFGRKSMPDYIVEASLLSKKVGRPVKVVWTREDDIKFDYFHAVAAMYLKAAVDDKGMPTAWLQRSVFTPIPSTFDASATYGGDDELGMGFTDIPFDIANLRVENGPAVAHVRIGWLRSVANVYHAFAVQSFMDELAHNAGRDPVEYLLALLGRQRILDLKATKYPNYNADYQKFPIDTARLRKVVEVVAEKSGWRTRRLAKGRGLGIAVHRSFVTYVASVVEVEVTPQGEVHIPRVDTALDAGLVVNPEVTRAQFQGANVFGASLALMGEITAKNGAIEQSNFNDYPVARINEAPRENNIYIVESSAPPAGVGEPGVPPFAPALCNAIFAATGKRIRELPLSKANLKT